MITHNCFKSGNTSMRRRVKDTSCNVSCPVMLFLHPFIMVSEWFCLTMFYEVFFFFTSIGNTHGPAMRIWTTCKLAAYQGAWNQLPNVSSYSVFFTVQSSLQYKLPTSNLFTVHLSHYFSFGWHFLKEWNPVNKSIDAVGIWLSWMKIRIYILLIL
jgi:hypothetical protein